MKKKKRGRKQNVVPFDNTKHIKTTKRREENEKSI